MKEITIENMRKAQKALANLMADITEDDIPVDTILKIKKSYQAINNIDFGGYEISENEGDNKFFEFTQNNSGGSFDVDDKVCHRLFIEANTIKEAKIKAMELGVYFDGVSMGINCSCCGDRWHNWMDDDDIITFPYKCDDNKIFSTMEEYAQYIANNYGATTPDARIFYKNGNVIEINGKSRY